MIYTIKHFGRRCLCPLYIFICPGEECTENLGTRPRLCKTDVYNFRDGYREGPPIRNVALVGRKDLKYHEVTFSEEIRRTIQRTNVTELRN